MDVLCTAAGPNGKEDCQAVYFEPDILNVLHSSSSSTGDCNNRREDDYFLDAGRCVNSNDPNHDSKHFQEGSVLLLKKCLYGLKQAVKVFWRQLLRAASAMGLKQNTADPCLYYKWVEGQLVMMMSWIDDNSIVGKESDIMDFKKALMNQFECKDCKPMDEYVGCTIEKLETGGIKI